ncbi:hypothetical protein RND71_009704 [Anisodus tanguticus]|uniref:Major facilitator superfamily (MFS) profile domain-containing protein n=1 Tax=Anisodus tanguticus TaxID=243964 RepID=A0AAE1SGA7_9SOLA|nr:hypothetical protein RND71_009704 [Anisodus tanguticus]
MRFLLEVLDDIGVMSGAVLFIRDNLKISSSQVEILVGSLNVCSLIGAFASAKTSAMIGRRYTIILAATTFLIGSLLMGLSPSYPCLMAGRVVAGIGVGYSLMIAPVYTAEVSPAMTQNDDEADLRLEEIIKAASLVGSSTPSNWKGQGVWKELLRPSLPFRRIHVAAIGINFFMQASGNDAVVYYTPSVFNAAGIHNRKGLIAVTILKGIAKTSFCIVSALFLDNFGRRSMLLLGTIGMAISLASLGLGSMYLHNAYHKPPWAITLCVVAVSADVSFFSIGLGPITRVYSSEISPIRLRAQDSSLAVSVNRLVSGVVAMTFLTISNKITFAGTFFMLCGVMVLATIFFYFFLPETKGQSLEEIWPIFEDKKDKIVEKETIER